MPGRRRVLAALLGVLLLAALPDPARGFDWPFGGSGPAVETQAGGDGGLVRNIFSEMRECWQCEILAIVYDGSMYVGYRVYNELREPVGRFVTILFGIWLLIMAARVLLPFGDPGGAREVWNTLFKRVFIAAVVLGLIWNFDLYWQWIYRPILDITLGLAALTLEASWGMLSAVGTDLDGAFGIGQCSVPPVMAGLENIDTAIGGGILSGRAEFLCRVHEMQSVVGIGAGVGQAMLTSWHFGFPMPWTDVLMPISGLLLTAVFFIVSIILPIYAIDLIFRMALVTMFAPIFLATLMFGRAADAGKRALRSLVQSGLVVVFQSAVMGIGAGVLARALEALGYANLESLIAAYERYQEMNLSDLWGSGETVPTLVDSGFWMLFLAGVVIFVLLSRASGLAAAFTQTGDNLDAGGRAASLVHMGIVATLGSLGAAGSVAAGLGAMNLARWGGGRLRGLTGGTSDELMRGVNGVDSGPGGGVRGKGGGSAPGTEGVDS